MKVKIFSGNNYSFVESEFNNWMRSSKFTAKDIYRIKQSQGSDGAINTLIISIFYYSD